MKIEEEIQQRKFTSPQQKAILNLMFTTNWIQARHQDFFKSFGITGQQFNILRILKGQYPKSISATEIRSRMLDKNSDVSRLLDRLAAKNLLVKKICPQDKRAADVFITTKGLKILKEINRKQNSLDSVLILSAEEAETLSNILDKSRG